MLADYHIHTNYSDDCKYLMEDVVKDAVSMGITEICFTDHVDYGVKTDWHSGEEVVYKAGMARLNVDYSRYYKEVLELQDKYAGKIKLKLGMEFGVQMHTLEKYERLFEKYPFEKVKPIIEEVLKTVIRDGKGIEVNTSCYRYGLKDLTPSRDILRLYRRLGGKMITIGSDSHKREDLGNYIEETKKELKELGFKEYCTYEKMQPMFHTL